MDALSDVLTAISHPSRRAIIGRLAAGPARFTDIARPFELSLNAITKHLKLLERAGLISREKQGREGLISLPAQPLPSGPWGGHWDERFWSERVDQFEGFFKEKRKKRP